jgi:hypothetical protein
MLKAILSHRYKKGWDQLQVQAVLLARKYFHYPWNSIVFRYILDPSLSLGTHSDNFGEIFRIMLMSSRLVRILFILLWCSLVTYPFSPLLFDLLSGQLSCQEDRNAITDMKCGLVLTISYFICAVILIHCTVGSELFFYLFFIILSGVRLSPLGIAATTGLLYQPQIIDDGDCGAIGGMKIGRRNRSTRRKPAPAPLCPPQIPLDQTRYWTRAATVGSQRLTASAMARPW